MMSATTPCRRTAARVEQHGTQESVKNGYWFPPRLSSRPHGQRKELVGERYQRAAADHAASGSAAAATTRTTSRPNSPLPDYRRGQLFLMLKGTLSDKSIQNDIPADRRTAKLPTPATTAWAVLSFRAPAGGVPTPTPTAAYRPDRARHATPVLRWQGSGRPRSPRCRRLAGRRSGNLP